MHAAILTNKNRCVWICRYVAHALQKLGRTNDAIAMFAKTREIVGWVKIIDGISVKSINETKCPTSDVSSRLPTNLRPVDMHAEFQVNVCVCVCVCVRACVRACVCVCVCVCV